jgi:single-strand DNA-binding protein
MPAAPRREYASQGRGYRRIRRQGKLFDIVVWAAQGEACARCLTQGSPVAIDGRLEWREWQVDAGGKRQRVEVIADRVQFLASGRREDHDPDAASHDVS